MKDATNKADAAERIAALEIALRGMLCHFGNPRRDEWMNEAAWREACAAEKQARAALSTSGEPREQQAAMAEPTIAERLWRAENALRNIEEACNYSPHREAGAWDPGLAALIHQSARLLPAAASSRAPEQKDGDGVDSSRGGER